MIHSKIHTKVKGQERVDRIRKVLAQYKEAFVSVGIHEDAGVYPGSNPPSVVEVALWNEFGTETSPERSWLRSTIDQNAGKINEWREEMIGNILEKGWTVQKALETIGFRIQLLLQNKIKSNVPPPLAPSTANYKQAQGRPVVTLIDTGLMLRSVTYKVHLK